MRRRALCSLLFALLAVPVHAQSSVTPVTDETAKVRVELFLAKTNALDLWKQLVDLRYASDKAKLDAEAKAFIEAQRVALKVPADAEWDWSLPGFRLKPVPPPADSPPTP